MKKIYTLTFLSVFALASKANIIYTDVMPDIVNTGNSTLDIDVNNDLTMDFEITGAQSGNLSFDIVQAGVVGTNNFVLSDGSGNSLALALNTVIGPSSTTWYQMNSTNLQMIIVANSVGSGTWSGATDKYLGLKFIVNTSTYYGWARFTFSSTSNTYTFKDYAYESTANTQILAGATLTSIKAPIANDLQVKKFPNPSSGNITFEFAAQHQQLTLAIYDLTGTIVKEISIPENAENITLDLSTLANGMYSYAVNRSFAGKLVIIE